MAPFQHYEALPQAHAISYTEPFLKRISHCGTVDQIVETMDSFTKNNNVDEDAAYFFLAKSFFIAGTFYQLPDHIQDFLLEKAIKYIEKELKSNKNRFVTSIAQKDSNKRISHPVSSMIIGMFQGVVGHEMEIGQNVKLHDYISIFFNKLIKTLRKNK